MLNLIIYILRNKKNFGIITFKVCSIRKNIFRAMKKYKKTAKKNIETI